MARASGGRMSHKNSRSAGPSGAVVAADEARVSGRGADRWRRQQHPWIYRSDVLDVPTVEAGAVRVTAPRGEELGMALWSPSSQIALRMITPRHEAVDGEFWHDRVERAWRYRQTLDIPGNAFRVIHGEGDGMPSLVVDWYDGHLVIQMLSAGLERFRAEIVESLRSVIAPAGILARNDVTVRDHEELPRAVELLYGNVPESIEVIENDIRYLAAPWTGQKTGAFLDQRENRLRVGEIAHGRALDCFSYHGSFALHLAARATHVTAIDSSAEALARAAENVVRNAPSITPDRIDFVEANAFDFLRGEEASGAQYDTIVLDPPAFAKRR